MAGKLLIIDVAALGYDFLRAGGAGSVAGMDVRATQSVFPAVTCSVQGSFRTARGPDKHGMSANGLYFENLRKAMFWEQSSALVAGERIWSDFRRRGRTVGMLFWQQSLGEDADVILSPAPIHLHHRGMIQDCYSRPAGLYESLCQSVGRKFNLMHYWGPLASWKVGEWIADAAVAMLAGRVGKDAAPDLLMVYLPSLDYDLQRHAGCHPKNARALAETISQLERMVGAGRKAGYEILIFGDYAIADVQAGDAAVFPNRRLLAEGFFATRQVKRMLYPDFHSARALVLVDHEVGLVHVKDATDIPAVAECLARLPHAKVVAPGGSGAQLTLVADDGYWLAYPWWSDKSHAPDYASHIDIHNKPGYDPCELFFGWPPMRISSNTARVRGSHGKVGPGRDVAYATTLPIAPAGDLVELASAVRTWLGGA